MLTYQLQRRAYVTDGNRHFIFPNEVEIIMQFEPPGPFGGTQIPSRTALVGSNTRISYDANVGRTTVLSTPPLPPVQVSLKYANLNFEQNGDTLVVHTKCNTSVELDNLITSLYYTLPLLLNVDFADPPTIKLTHGKVGEIGFERIINTSGGSFDATSPERQEKRVLTALERLQFFNGTSNRRLAAALYYFHTSCRLMAAGNSPWEFMAETILNLSKTLEVLFGQNRDEIRSGLIELGYAEDEIETYFIPINVLRNQFDVGHVNLSIFQEHDLEYIYRYLEIVENKFRTLILKIIEKVEAGSHQFDTEQELAPDTDKQRILDRLIDKFKSNGIK